MARLVRKSSASGSNSEAEAGANKNSHTTFHSLTQECDEVHAVLSAAKLQQGY